MFTQDAEFESWLRDYSNLIDRLVASTFLYDPMESDGSQLRPTTAE